MFELPFFLACWATVNRRHTMQYGRHNIPRATAHDLHEGIREYQQRVLENKERDLPAEVVEQFNDKSREVRT